jgi:glutaredoxin
MITIYVTNHCPACDFLKSQLTPTHLANVRFINIDTQPEFRHYFDATGSRSAPTAVIQGRAYIGAPSILAAIRSTLG